MIRTCVIGLGNTGAAHAAAYCALDQAQLVGVCDPGLERAQALAARLKTAAFAEVGAMLAAARPDLVSICGGDQFAGAMQALEAGCHVLCEVPLASDAARAGELVALAWKRGVCLAADFNMRFAPALVRAKQWVEEGRLGTPLFVNLALWPRCEDERNEAALRRLACHGFDLMRCLCGEIESVQCFGAEAPGGGEWSSAQVNLRFASGVVGGMTVSAEMPAHHPVARCEVAGTTARVEVHNIYEEVTLYPHAEEEKTVITNSIWRGLGGYEDTYRCRISRLLEQLSAGAAPAEIEGSGAEAVAAQVVLEAAMDSLNNGDVVRVGPA